MRHSYVLHTASLKASVVDLLAVSSYLRTYETHALKEAVANTRGPHYVSAYLRTYETHALKEAVAEYT
jgi:phosphohistidine phosphatase SixA